jgi:aminoglycoside phosphotransferase (APT) family kinase protein
VRAAPLIPALDLTPKTVAWIERAMGRGARVVRIEPFPVSSTAKCRIDVVLEDGSTRRLVLRRYHDAERRARDPWYVPAHEALALQLLAGAPVPVPHLLAADLEGEACDVPALLESWLPGDAARHPEDLDRYLFGAAQALAAIHAVRVPPGVRLPRYAPYRGSEPIVSPGFSTRPGLWERVAAVLGSPPAHRETFIHRDYHPGNILWDGPRVTGVVDWATASWGPAGIDLARMRVNVAALHGSEAADRFALAYAAAGGDASARHPYWDLLDAADLLLDLSSPLPGGGDMARFENYVERVLTG